MPVPWPYSAVKGSGQLSHAAIRHKAWPITLASAAVPLLGLADTAVRESAGDAMVWAGISVLSCFGAFPHPHSGPPVSGSRL